jgi:hypothetical protein
MTTGILRAALAACVVVMTVAAASAADPVPSRQPGPTVPAPLATPSAPWSFLSEVRLGAFAHDPWSPEKGSVDLNGEILTPKLFRTVDPTWEWLVPRFHLGGTANFNGRTSHAYAGLTWTYDITSAFFIEGSLGGSANDGETGRVVPPDHSALGCHVMFRESASLGYRITSSVSVMGSVEHISNAGLCDQNRGLTNVGLRLGYSF